MRDAVASRRVMGVQYHSRSCDEESKGLGIMGAWDRDAVEERNRCTNCGAVSTELPRRTLQNFEGILRNRSSPRSELEPARMMESPKRRVSVEERAVKKILLDRLERDRDVNMEGLVRTDSGSPPRPGSSWEKSSKLLGSSWGSEKSPKLLSESLVQAIDRSVTLQK